VIDYRTLNVRVEHLHEHTYEAIVHGPGGDGRVQFDVPTDMPDLEAVAVAVSRPRSARRRIETTESALAREFGERLFDLVFQGTARDVMRMSLAEARNDEQGLRMMLELEGAPGLRNVPWELLWDRPKFISTSAYTPIVRYVDLPVRPRPLEVKPPLRVLGMVSSPGDVRALDTEGERVLLSRACGKLDAQNLLEIDWVQEASLRGLLERLNSGSYHIFHFIGHGDFDESAEDGVLLFEGSAGRSHRVTGTELGTILSDHHTLRLAVINACEGARVADDWGGIAGSLMQYGLPAVIAMQFEISDDAALSFARCFYSSVARNHPVDEALADARRGMFADGYGLEWATPVMFTSVADCRLFDVRWEQAPATPARLAVGLELEPAGAAGGKELTWRVELRNEGALELSELQPLAGDGRPLSKPFSLAAGERRTVTSIGDAGEDGEGVVTVAGVDSEGRIVSERATAVAKPADIAEPPAEPSPAAVRPAAAASTPAEAPRPKPAERPRPKPAEPEPAPVASAARAPAPPAPPSAPPGRAAPVRPRRRRAPRVIAGIVAAGVAAAVLATLAGGGAAGTIAHRLPMPDDATVLTANRKTALVSGAGSTLTEINLEDRTKSIPVRDLGTVVPARDAPEGRSIAVTDAAYWIDSDSEHVIELARDGTRAQADLQVPRSSDHQLATSSDAIWALSPDTSEISRLPFGSNDGPSEGLNIPAHSATQLAVTDRKAYVLYEEGDSAHQRIATVDQGLNPAAPPASRLAGRAIRTGDNFLMVLHGDTVELVSTLPHGARHSIEVGAGARAVDFNGDRLWVTYEDGTLKRFSTAGEAGGDPLDLGGDPLAIDARDDRAWVLVATDAGKKELLDVRP
jgi:hypothetical protein